MKTKNLSVLLLLTVFFTALSASAANPRQHHLHGVVQSVDAMAGTLTLQKSVKAQPLVILWNERTKFRDEKEPGKPEDLKAGQSVCVYYRVLPGRREASRVVVRREPGVREKGSAKGGARDLMKH